MAAIVWLTVLQVAHQGAWVDDRVDWTVRWRSDAVEHRLDLASPLPAEAVVRGRGVRPVLGEGGRIEAVTLDAPHHMGQFSVTVPQDADAHRLAVPLLDGPAVQRVVVDGLDVHPDDSLGMEKHTRYWAPAALAGDARRDFERDWRRSGGARARPWDQAVYLVEGPATARGLPARLQRAGAVSPAVHVGLLGALLALLGFAFALYRGLERQARDERNAVYIERNFRH